jgi:hypothetical protein
MIVGLQTLDRMYTGVLWPRTCMLVNTFERLQHKERRLAGHTIHLLSKR